MLCNFFVLLFFCHSVYHLRVCVCVSVSVSVSVSPTLPPLPLGTVMRISLCQWSPIKQTNVGPDWSIHVIVVDVRNTCIVCMTGIAHIIPLTSELWNGPNKIAQNDIAQMKYPSLWAATLSPSIATPLASTNQEYLSFCRKMLICNTNKRYTTPSV